MTRRRWLLWTGWLLLLAGCVGSKQSYRPGYDKRPADVQDEEEQDSEKD